MTRHDLTLCMLFSDRAESDLLLFALPLLRGLWNLSESGSCLQLRGRLDFALSILLELLSCTFLGSRIRSASTRASRGWMLQSPIPLVRNEGNF